MARRLRELYSFPKNRTCVIPSAVTLEHSNDVKGGDIAERRVNQLARGRIKLLTLSRYYPHKNFEFVVETAAALKEKGDDRFVFFITIAADQHPGAEAVLEAIEMRRLTDAVVNIGPIALEDLPATYRASDALFYPTLLESFSGTYLEAMQYRLPILTTDVDFAHYCCGPAALYFDPKAIGTPLRGSTLTCWRR
jgi:glycosyltransferase involved in cell wall biosynthesis